MTATANITAIIRMPIKYITYKTNSIIIATNILNTPIFLKIGGW